MKQKLLLRRVLSCLLLIAFSVSSWADVEESVVDGIKYRFDTVYRVASVISNNYKGSVTIPSEVEYNGRQYVVKYIRKKAFSECFSLSSVSIPESVTSIGDSAFFYCSRLTSVTIPESVTYIGEYAFQSCQYLTSVTIPESVTAIGYHAFWNCTLLNSVTVNSNAILSSGSYPMSYIFSSWIGEYIIGESVTTIGYSAFQGCDALKAVTIGKGVTSISSNAFRDSPYLTSVTLNSNAIASKDYNANSTISKIFGSQVETYIIGEGVTKIGSYAFYNCSAIKSLTIGDGVTSIGGYAFNGCSALKSVTIGEGVTSIGNYAFDGCSGMTSVTLNSNAIVSRAYSSNYHIGDIFGSQVKEYIIGESVTSIGERAFYGSSALTSVSIGEGVTSIGSYAFSLCSGLSSVTMPNGVTSIGQSAFYGCSGLTSLTMPENVTFIGDFAFNECSCLTSVIIPDGVPEIGKYTFYGCSGLTSLTIGKGVTSIGEAAFRGCYNVSSVTLKSDAIVSKEYDINSNIRYLFGSPEVREFIIGEGVTSIGSYAFSGCSSLTSVTIPESVTSIGECAFYECSNLTSLTIPERVTKIGMRAFQGCRHLAVVTIPKGVTSIGGGTFSGCSGLTSVSIPEGVTSIGDNAFADCTGLKKAEFASVNSLCRISFGSASANPLFNAHHLFIDGQEVTALVLPAGMTSIGGYTFSGFSGLTSVIIPQSVTSIGEWAFYGCSGLSSVAIPERVTSIGEWAFSNCSGLTSVAIPEGVTSIGRYAFKDCSGLTSVTCYAMNVPTTGSDVFYRTPQRTSILYVPASAVEAYKAAEQWNEFSTILPISSDSDAAWESIKSEAESLASDNDAVAVGLLRDALAVAYAVTTATENDMVAMQSAIDQFKRNNADVVSDQTAKVATNGWKKFDGTAAGVCATQYAPAINTYDGRIGVQLAEVFEGNGNRTGTIIYQDITGLTNGTYRVGFYANAFSTSNRDGFECTMADGAEDVAYVFANGQQAFIAAYIATSTTENDFREFDVEVTDGTIRLGMGKAEGMDKSTNWHTMQIYQLTWFTTAKALYAQDKATMSALIAEAQALRENPYKLNGKAKLIKAISNAQTALENNRLTIAEFEAAIEALRTAMNDFEAANYVTFDGTYYVRSADGKYMAAGHEWGTRGIVNETGLDLIAATNSEGKVTLDSRVSNGGDNHFLGSNLYMDAGAYGWTVEPMNETGYSISNGTQYIGVDAEDNLMMSDTPVEWRFVRAETVLKARMASLSGAMESNPVDVTWMLGNPNFNRNDQRVSAWQVSEDCTNKNFNGGNNVNNCAESYHSPFTISQTLSDIPAGTYELTAQGFYRQDEGLTENAPFFFLGTQTQSLDEMGVLPDANGNNLNDMSDASVAFSEGVYTITPIRFLVGEGESLTLGVSGVASQQWVCFDNFHLTYLGLDNVTGISPLQISPKGEESRAGKYVENGRIVIVKNGKRYNVAGQREVK